MSPTRLERLREETAKDEELQILSNVIRKGWPETLAQACENDKRQKQVIELYWNSRDELTTEDGLVYKGHRLVIPAGEHSDIVKSLHESHIGVEGTLRRALILFTGRESRHSSRITYRNAVFVTGIDLNNVESHYSPILCPIYRGRKLGLICLYLRGSPS